MNLEISNFKSQISNLKMQIAKLIRLRRTIILLFAFYILHSPAWGAATSITADVLDHYRDDDRYVAIGNVKIEKDKTIVYADRAVLYNKSSDAELKGHVIYEDDSTVIHSEQADLNLDTRTGKLYNALIFLKSQKPLKGGGAKIGYWIKADDVRKIKDDHYYASTAIFTSCEPKAVAEGAPGKALDDKIFAAGSPEWCFKGHNVDMRVGKKVTASNATYRVKGLPILYSPYLWAPIKSERETGFLFPLIGNSSTKGFQFGPSFFWAIDENKDATFNADYYSKRGIGKGAEYRYLDFDSKGQWYVYHLKDKELNKTYYQLKGMHEQQFGDLRGFADVNYVNEGNFYREFAYKRSEQVQRFLQSTGEASLPLRNSRLYFLGQYWVDLQDDNAHVPQRLPEIGYVINTTGIGPVMFYMSSSVTNFVRRTEVSGQRVDINPTVSHSFGDRVQVFQSVSLRETAYNLKGSAPFDSTLHRETFEYRANALTRLIKRYGSSTTHIIEPSLTYTFIPETHPLPAFDSTELFDKVSTAQFALLNTLYFRNFTVWARVTQPYDFNAASHTLPPTLLEASVSSGPFSLSMNMYQDFNKMKTETFNTTLAATVFKGTTINLSEYYSRASGFMQYYLGLTSALTNKWSIIWNVGYDTKKGQGLRDLTLRNIYSEKCWAVDLAFTRKPGYDTRPPEYSFLILFELKGLGGFKPYEYSSQSQQKT